MAEDLNIIEGSKEEQYQALIPQIQGLLTGENNLIANLANMAAALKEQFGFIFSITPYGLIKSMIEQKKTLKDAEIGKGYTVLTLNKNGDETYKEGSIPSLTIRSDIDYAIERAQTVAGTIGLKIWVYKGDVFKK